MLEERVEALENQSLSKVEVEDWDLRQVRAIAPIQVTVTEHQAKVKCCPHCQTLELL